ncbi:MAG TPA: AbrB/MazE/SpoVT family DNA-binding domain-containing protein [Bryobacteraceae bacterium]|nr:AbrB/MazE/SpoVT family DNA-binding domain-containing protein [Bryobacteraceae bacterium]
MLTSKITQKGQTTIPREVRVRLEVRPGDSIAYETTAAGVVIRKVRPYDASWHSSVAKTLEAEWNSPEDAEDFGDL